MPTDDNDKTQPPAEHRTHKGPGTVALGKEQIAAEKEITLAKIAAAEHETWGELIARVLHELRPLIAETLAGVSSLFTACRPIVLGLGALCVLALAVYMGRTLYIFGLGSTGTGDAPSAPVEAPAVIVPPSAKDSDTDH